MNGAQRSGRPVAWITGASQGIGRALALELVARGWRVAASARSVDKLAALEAEVAPDTGAIVAFALDVRDPKACAAALKRIEAEMGPVDLGVLNAGTHRPMTAESFDVEGVRALVDLNLMGTVNVLAPLLQRMRGRDQGQVAIVASLSGYRGLPTASGYGASKAALINLCEALKLDLAQTGVKIQVVNPGFVRTPLTDRNPFPMPDLISAERAARYLADGLEGASFEIRFPPRFALLMGLLRILPYRLYFPLIRRITGG